MDGDTGRSDARFDERFLDAIERSVLLASVAAERRTAVLEALRLRRVERMQGEALCNEGDVATSFWLLTRGRTTVTGRTPSGGVFVEQRGPGDLVGELAAMRPGSRRSATIRALDQQVEAYCLSMRAIDALPCEDRLGIWQGLAVHVAGKLAATVPARTSASIIADERETLLRRFVNEDALGKVRAEAQGGRADAQGSYERREAVILFADLVGFSAMAERAEPEDVARSIKAAMSVQADLVEEHGGFVDKLMGDGLMAYWLPEADTPEERKRAAAAAVDAAFAAADRVAALSHPVTHRPLAVRIGLHIGKVHYGNFGSDRRWAVTLIGQPVNIAARIESAKPANGEREGFGLLRVSSEMAELLDSRHLDALPDRATVTVKSDIVTFIHRKPE